MKRPWHLPLALLTGLACSVYSADLLREQPDPIAEGGTAGGTADAGLPDTSSAGSGSGSGSGSDAGSGGSGGTGGSSAGTASAGGSDAGTDAPPDGVGQGGCIGAGGADGEELDCCPSDPEKTEPGVCGCGVPDSDGDMDGTVDCEDGCPADGAKTSPGACGCGFVDATCDELETALVHRYSFGGTGTEVTDSVGGAHGTVVGGTLADGSVTLAGLESDEHVDLPDGIVSVLTDATFEIWASWGAGPSWQRLFDFGDQTSSGTGRTYLFFTPQNQQGYARVAYKRLNASEIVFTDSAAFPLVVQSHAAVVVDDTNDVITLYVNGQLRGSVAFAESLSSINDVNNWLGRSNYNVDPDFAGSITEFRIYEVALSEAQVALSFELGPDPMFLAD